MSRPMQLCVWDENQAKIEKRPVDTPPSSRTSFGLFDGLFFFGGNLRLNLHVEDSHRRRIGRRTIQSLCERIEVCPKAALRSWLDSYPKRKAESDETSAGAS